MTQLALSLSVRLDERLGPWPRIETPASRPTDPETSHEAAEAITASGIRSDQQRAVLSLIRRYPGHTAGELAVLTDTSIGGSVCDALSPDVDLRYFQIQRRVSELAPRFVRRDGSRPCSVRGTKQTTLWPAGGEK